MTSPFPPASMPGRLEAGVSVFPDFDALGGSDLIFTTLGALLTVVLVFALLMLLVSIIAWALGAASGSVQVASRGRIGTLVALGAATLAGAGVALMNFLIEVGTSI